MDGGTDNLPSKNIVHNMHISYDTIEFPNGRRGMLSRWVAPCSDAQEVACQTWNLLEMLQMEFV